MKINTNTLLYLVTTISLASSGLFMYAQRIELTDPTNASVVEAIASWCFAGAALAVVGLVFLKVAKKHA